MRKPVVTRVIRCRKYTVNCADKAAGKLVEKHFYTYQAPPDDAAALRLIKKINTDTNIIPTYIVKYEVIKGKYMQSVEDFIQHGTLISEEE